MNLNKTVRQDFASYITGSSTLATEIISGNFWKAVDEGKGMTFYFSFKRLIGLKKRQFIVISNESYLPTTTKHIKRILANKPPLQCLFHTNEKGLQKIAQIGFKVEFLNWEED